MNSQDQVISELIKLIKDVDIYSINSKQIRVDTHINSVEARQNKTEEVKQLFNGATTEKARPYDVLIPGGFKILVKPSPNSKKVASGAYYGILEDIDLSAFNLREFSEVCKTFTGGNLVRQIKEASDIKCVTDFNKEIVKLLGKNKEGVTLKIHGFSFENVIGCVPVTNGEPKADVVLVCKKGNILYPDCFMSYKMGTNAKGFQNYSGLSEKSSPYIFNHPDTLKFYQTLYSLSKQNIKEDVYQLIEDKKIIGMSVWGMDFSSGKYGINKCHFIAQGEVSISGNTFNYSHTQKCGDMNFGKEYQPVFGARYATGRNNKGPKGLTANNFRIGIFPRAYRSKWLS